MSYLGKNIRMLRKAKGLSILELARISKASPASISQIENGKRDATFKLILNIAQALDIEVSILVTPPTEENYKHDIQSVIRFTDNYLIIGKSVDSLQQDIYWGAVFNLSNDGSLVDTLYVKQNGKSLDSNAFLKETLNSYLIQQRFRILMWKCIEVDKTYLEVVKQGIEWHTAKEIITHLGLFSAEK
ncbi:helix-turn-helix domain-containing protein [Priestia aryabhattai]|uniref:helix-turn-helix domain-containing protein n=1 Tax=Priestia aryabhattai TaxID=412384 RepID=UPI001C8D6613|nr:helix-turn-helix transcriptional regulator [Priestia aryabhattai]MBY0025616.1 helix-turn-helix domain-containing protein [Priestia aryabhattai]